jgi:hypothetical protein
MLSQIVVRLIVERLIRPDEAKIKFRCGRSPPEPE